MRRYAADLDETMRRVVDAVPDTAPGLSVMVRYPLGWVDEQNQPYPKSTGKRIRPMFLLLCNEAAGGDWHQALYAAASVELLHNFSLVHDDIQDDSSIRHSRPTVWRVWGRPNAINAGDLLFALSYAALNRLDEAGVPPETIMAIWRVFNQTNLELTRGQHLDMRFEGQSNVTVDEYISMISGKSAALLSACAQIGALIATGDYDRSLPYAQFALNMGIAFQIRDDILGIWGEEAVIGKSAATDILSKKKSLPVLYGLQQSQQLVDIYSKDELNEADVQAAVELLDSIDAKQFAMEKEQLYYDRALQSLDQADPQGQAGQWLRQFVAVLFRRNY